LNKKKDRKGQWLLVKLGDVFTTTTGGTPRTDVSEYWENGSLPWINSGALTDDFINSPTTYITEMGLSKSSAKLLPKGSILIALTGATMGKVGLLKFSCSTSQNVTAIYPSKHYESKLLFYYLIHIRESLVRKATGAAQPHINKTVIDETRIPIMPLEHQRQIVKKLDKIQQAINNVEKKSSKISQLEDNALGSLVNLNKEQLSELKDLCFLRNERVKEKWHGKRLLGVSNSDGIVDLRITKKQSFSNYKIVYPGDFIYNPMRINIGSIAIHESNEIAITSPDYIVFYTVNSLSRKFLLKFLKSEAGLGQIATHLRGSVRSRLYFDSLQKIIFPFVSQEYQQNAERILIGFDKAKSETVSVINELKKIIKDTFIKCFTEGEIKISSTLLPSQIVELMKSEKSKRVVSAKSNRKAKKVQSIKNHIKTDFVEKITSFLLKEEGTSFESLWEKSGLQYDELKDSLYELIDKEILIEFDPKQERMVFKAK
jgi:type I restriction enzyme S subunit